MDFNLYRDMSDNPQDTKNSPNHFKVLDAIARGLKNIDKISKATRLSRDEEILSSEVTAKADNKGMLRVLLPKKTRPQDIKSRSITVE